MTSIPTRLRYDQAEKILPPREGWTPVDWRWAHEEIQRRKLSGRMTSGTFISDDRRIRWANKDFLMADGRPAGGAVVQWLKSVGAKRRPIQGKWLWVVSAPSYARVGAYRRMVYLDVKSAYHSIYRRLWWDVECLPGTAWASGTISLADFPYPDDRNARNALIGIAASRKVVLWRHGVPKVVNTVGGLQNPHLAQAVWLILHYVAVVAVQHGAVYWHIDGGILPVDAVEAVYRIVRRTVGLTVRPKSSVGNVVVYGVGVYDGRGKGGMGKASKLVQYVRHVGSFNNLRPDWAYWAAAHYRRLLDR